MQIATDYKKNITFTIIFVVLLCLSWFYFIHNNPTKKTTKYIGYVGRYTDPKKPNSPPNSFDLMHETSLREYVRRLTSPYHDFQLKIFDSKSDSATIVAVYESIAKDSNIVAVVDNTWGEHLQKAAPIIRTKNIPVVSINADHNHLDFGRNVIFTGNNDNVPDDITSYLTQVSNVKKIHFITEFDYPVNSIFLSAFQKNNIAISHTFEVKGRGFSPQDSIKLYSDIINYIKQHPTSLEDIWVFNVHSTIGSNLIQFLDNHFNNLKLMGHAYIINQSYLKNFGHNNNNTLILISNPTDAVSRDLYLDIETLKNATPEYFLRPNHSMFVKRCFDALEILKHKFEFEPDTFSLLKSDFTRYIHQLQGQVINNEYQIYDIDSTMTVLPELFFSEYKSGKLYSMPLQLNKTKEVIPNLFFGMEIVDIYNINVNENSFTSDFYYWVKLDSTLKTAEQYIIFQNMKSNQSSKELIFEKTEGRTIYKLYKVSGIFYVNYDLTRYPFDEQEIYITAEILNPSSRIKISFDQKSFELDKNKIDRFKITEWQKKKFFVTVDTHVGYSMHGDPDVDADRKNEFKSINFRLFVKRKILSPLLEIVLPLLLFGIISIALLFIKDISFENMGEVSVGVFMAIVAFSISFSASTPHSDNLTKADWLFWLTFTVVFLNFLIIIIINAMYEPEMIKTVNIRKINVYFGIAYFLTVLYLLLM